MVLGIDPNTNFVYSLEAVGVISYSFFFNISGLDA